MSETAKVDLSLAKPGDTLQRRDGKLDIFKHKNIEGRWATENGSTYDRHGVHCHAENCHADIVRLISRASATAEPVAEDDWDGLMYCSKCKGPGMSLSGCMDPECSMKEAADAPAAVITGPGPHVQKDGLISHVVAKHVSLWVGFDSEGTPAAWDANGQRCDAAGVVDKDIPEWFITGPYVEPPPKPVLTITEVKSTDGYVFGLVWKDPSLKHVSLKLHVYNGIPCSYIQGGALGLANSEQSPFVCRYDEWDAVQNLVAEINAIAPSAG